MKIENIATVLQMKNKKPDYDNHEAYSEKKFLDLLQNINLNTVMIVHQKGSLLSNKKPLVHDANSVGEEKLEELLYTEYFEAFEFRNKKNELFSKKYIVDKKYQELLRLITCSDCHNWKTYPKIDSDDNEDFIFTWLKCLPTFRGLVMAMTDYTRIKRNNSFFSVGDKFLKQISFDTRGEEITVPLSKGINVIIGDNSIGKSLLLHKLTDFSYSSANQKKGYQKYLKENNFDVLTKVDDQDIFIFDVQGGIRDKFEKNKLNDSKFLKDYYPKQVSLNHYENLIDAEIKRYCKSLKSNVEYNEKINDLDLIKFHIDEDEVGTLSLIDNLNIININKDNYAQSITSANEIIQSLNNYLVVNDKLFFEIEKENIKEFIKYLEGINKRMQNEIDNIVFQNKKINIIKGSFLSKAKEIQDIKSDKDKESKAFYESLESVKEKIQKLVKMKNNINEYYPSIQVVNILPLVNEIYNYKFISKINIDKIDNNYILNLIKSIHKSSGLNCDYDKLTNQIIIDSIKNYPEGEENWEKVFDEKSKAKYSQDFMYKSTILNQSEIDLTREMSSGSNMQIYFDLISYNGKNKGIYIVDQPEDSVSQKAIKEYLLDRFKSMCENRQVIIVTHNPQFIVNLDVDNVIFISKNEKTQLLEIQSGALEFEEKKDKGKYRILDIVANNIDGGIETINRRWKRYEKGIDF